MPKFSHGELAVLVVLVAVALVAVGYRLATSSTPSTTPAPREMTYIPAPKPLTSPPSGNTQQPPVSQSARVHIVGAVRNPGLYSLPSGSRVEEAIRAAGGFTMKARTDAINLAARIEDGQQINVPEVAPPQPAPPATGSASKQHPPASTNAVSTPAAPVNPKPNSSTDAPPAIGIVSLNSADQSQLEKLPGVGPEFARRILDYRNSHGGFKSIEELKQVPGIGERRFESMRLYVRL